MSESRFMSEAEIVELTGKVRHSAQARALNQFGIDHKIRPDGSVVVLRSVADRVLGERTPKSKMKVWEPVFS